MLKSKLLRGGLIKPIFYWQHH